MIVTRSIFHAKYGKGDALVTLLKELNERPDTNDARIMVDLSGTFFTVVMETEHENMGAWEARMGSITDDPERAAWFGEWFGRMSELVESGSREFFKVV